MVVGHAIRFMGSLVEGGWSKIMERNHRLALEGRDLLADRLKVAPPCPDSMLGSMAALPLPDAEEDSAGNHFDLPPLQQRLFDEYRIEVPVVPWPRPPKRLLRASFQLYNGRPDVERLAVALGELLR